MGRVANIISILWETSLSFEESLGATRGKAASRAASLVRSATFFASSDGFTSLEEMLVEGRALVGLSLPSSIPEETGLALEPEELELRMAWGGSTHSLLS